MPQIIFNDLFCFSEQNCLLAGSIVMAVEPLKAVIRFFKKSLKSMKSQQLQDYSKNILREHTVHH